MTFIQEFKSVEDIIGEFEGGSEDLKGATIHLAWYGYGDYCGAAFVLYEKGGKLYEVDASHCSCYGLEGQWKPEETTWEALRYVLEKGTKFYSDQDGEQEAEKALQSLVAEHLG